MTFFDDGLERQVEATDADMLRILHDMLENDEKITARAVARKHPTLSHASSITRSASRLELLTRFQAEQKRLREWQDRLPKRSQAKLAAQLAHKDTQIADLERQVEILRLSHIFMMQAVGELGGTSKLRVLYDRYRDVRGELQRLGLLSSGELKSIAAAKASKAAD